MLTEKKVRRRRFYPLNQRDRLMMVMMTQISSALSSLREKIKDTDQPAKHCFTSNPCF